MLFLRENVIKFTQLQFEFLSLNALFIDHSLGLSSHI